METSFQMTHNISASGGTDKLRYRISGGYTSNDGVLVSDRDKFERMNINTFISADVTNWFTQEVTMSYAHSLQTSPGGMGGVYNTRLVSYYPKEICRHQSIRWQTRIFLCSLHATRSCCRIR